MFSCVCIIISGLVYTVTLLKITLAVHAHQVLIRRSTCYLIFDVNMSCTMMTFTSIASIKNVLHFVEKVQTLNVSY